MAANNKFIRRLRREITSSPKKAAVLGLSLVVAIWFWTPLVAKWTGAKSGGDETPAAPAGTEAIVANSTPVSQTTAAKTATPNWHQVLEWMRNDPLMQSYTADRQRARSVRAGRFATGQARRIAAADCRTAGVIAGTSRAGVAQHGRRTAHKTALINGRAYHEQQSVVAANGRDRFVLVEIRPSSIVLQRHGRSFELKLPRVEATSTEE